jgi:anti-sigma B factor antagonist
MSTPSLFRVEVQSEREHVRVIPHGELDVATTSELDAEIEQLWSGGCATIVLDLRQLEFMDSTGLRLLLRLDADARSNGLRFAIVDDEGPVRRLLELTRTYERLDHADG